MKNVYKIYEKISDWYELHRSRELFEKPYLDKVISFLRPRASILDLGCGTGEPIARYFLEKGYGVTGIDGSFQQIRKAKSRFSNGYFIVGDMRTIHLSTQFDAIIAWHSFFHLPFEYHIQPGGILLFTSGPEEGEVWSDNGGEMLYHASLSTMAYQSLLAVHHFEVLDHKIEDPECGDATVWLARYRGV